VFSPEVFGIILVFTFKKKNMTSKVTYLGDLRTSSIHLQSGTQILSDAPTDNQGKGEAFSPTDLVANALGSCTVSIMAIKSKDLDLDLVGSTVFVTKIMQAEPRKIDKIIIVLNMSVATTDKNKTILERVAKNCPVLLSLNADIEKEITFNWK
jgi:uncharacterized OsmC-like protein